MPVAETQTAISRAPPSARTAQYREVLEIAGEAGLVTSPFLRKNGEEAVTEKRAKGYKTNAVKSAKSAAVKVGLISYVD